MTVRRDYLTLVKRKQSDIWHKRGAYDLKETSIAAGLDIAQHTVRQQKESRQDVWQQVEKTEQGDFSDKTPDALKPALRAQLATESMEKIDN